MELCTWNIIFIGIDIIERDSLKNHSQNKTIQKGINIFKRDVNESDYSERLKITLLQFESKTALGTAIVYGNENLRGKNSLRSLRFIKDFDCQKSESYSGFLTDCIEKAKRKNDVQKESKEQKYLLIFLAHSFGAGFFPIKTGKAPTYFNTLDLNKAISETFKDKKLDCLIALNCSLQSIETNIIFENTVKYLISSQLPFEIIAVTYKKLLADLIFTTNTRVSGATLLDDEIIFTKFPYNCYSQLLNQLKKLDEFKWLNQYAGASYKLLPVSDNFCMSVTLPERAATVKAALQKLFNLLDLNLAKTRPEPDIFLLSFAINFCIDPSYYDRVNVIDAHQFFLKLRTFYTKSGQKPKKDAIDEVLLTLNKIVLLNVSSGNACEDEVDEYGLAKMYIPRGIGMLMPKLLSGNLTVELNVYLGIFRANRSALNRTDDPVQTWFDLLIGMRDITIYQPSQPRF